MSGEGSSSGTKRKRRASTRGQEQPTDAPLRIVTDRGDGIPHGQSSVLWDSPLLQRIDWEMVGRLRQVERLEQLLGEKFMMALDCDAP
ncbi:hypothetical protein Hanom_Chr14g01259091 [Helianthus anomalus]